MLYILIFYNLYDRRHIRSISIYISIAIIASIVVQYISFCVPYIYDVVTEEKDILFDIHKTWSSWLARSSTIVIPGILVYLILPVL